MSDQMLRDEYELDGICPICGEYVGECEHSTEEMEEYLDEQEEEVS